jgi:putative GTP pyrophosphokinase
MKESETSPMVAEYVEEIPLYEAYTKKIEELIKALLEESNTQVHSVTSRTKEIDRFSEKVKREGKGYKKLSDVTDLSGVRIICYFADQVDTVAKLIGDYFRVHSELSIDKREILDPDRFGYLSLHYIVELSKERASLPEYERFKNLLCEVQMRSILQHAWAEIEHDLGYKSSIEVPRDIRRRFCRLAGLLELADDEFDDIKKDITLYTERVAAQISFTPENVLIDSISLEHYMNNSSTVEKIDNAIGDLTGIPKDAEEYEFESNDIESLVYFNIQTIAGLDKALNENKDKIIAFAKIWMEHERMEGASYLLSGISLFYLFYVLAGSTQDNDKVIGYLDISKITSDRDKKGFAKNIIETYKKISRE